MTGLVCDLLLEHRLTGDVIVTDVRVTHPRRDSSANCTRPLAAAEAHWELKHRLYSKQYKIGDSAIELLLTNNIPHRDLSGAAPAQDHPFYFLFCSPRMHMVFLCSDVIRSFWFCERDLSLGLRYHGTSISYLIPTRLQITIYVTV